MFYPNILCFSTAHKDTNIKISEFLNNDFCKSNNITDFFIFNGSREGIICGEIKEGVRYYILHDTAQYGIKFNWYVDKRECSITLSANSDGSIKIVDGEPSDKDLEENKDVKIRVGEVYLSLADAVKTCKQKSNEASSNLSQPSSEHFRPVRTPVIQQR